MELKLNLTDAQVTLLREGLDELPLAKYITLIVPLLNQLPLTEFAAAPDSQANSAPAPLESREVAGGFKVSAYTPRGVSVLDALENVLGRLPHGGTF